MNWVDVALVLIVAVSVIGGFRKGFIRIGIGLAATILAFLLASYYYAEAGGFFRGYTSSQAVADFIGFLAVLIGVIAIGSLIGHLMTRFSKLIGLSWFDKLMGAGFGFVRGVLVAAIFLAALAAFVPGDPPSVVAKSATAPYLMSTADTLVVLAPANMRSGFRRTYGKVKRYWLEPMHEELEKIKN